MSGRSPLPIRLVQSEWARRTMTKDGIASSPSSPPSSLLAFYKPSAVPMYPSESAQHAERRLFSPNAPLLLPSKFTSDIAAAKSASASGAASSVDSCFTRLLGSLPPGAHPALALPMLSPLHYRLDSSLQCNNERTCFGQKGVSLVVRSVAYQTPRDAPKSSDAPQQTAATAFGIPNQAMFLRQCQRFGFVRSTYHVLVRLPGCVATRMLAAEVERRHVRAADLLRKQRDSQAKSLVSSGVDVNDSSNAGVARLNSRPAQLTNPYLREHVEEKRKKRFYGSGGAVGGGDGDTSARHTLERYFMECVPYEQADGRSSLFPFLPPWWTSDPATEAESIKSGRFSQQLRDCRSAYGSALPPCARCDPLFHGSFYETESGLLKLSGKVAGVLARGGGESERREVAKAHRLSNLFLPFNQTSSSGSSAAEDTSSTQCASCVERRGGKGHPWIPESSRVYSTTGELSSSSQRSKRGVSRTRLVEQPFAFDFRLLQVGDTGDFALYEVTTKNATEAELRYAFASASLYVLNDYEYDITLANYVNRVNEAIRVTPKALLSGLPLRFQQRTTDATPLESVVEPLFRLGLPAAEGSTEEEEERAESASHPSSLQLGGDAFHVQLLCRALTQCTRDTSLSTEVGRFLQSILLLQCGSGIELRKLVYPSVTSQQNSFVMQQVLQLHEQHHGTLSTDAVRDFTEQLQFESKYVADGEEMTCDTFSRLLTASTAAGVPATDCVKGFASAHMPVRSALNLLSLPSPLDTTSHSPRDREKQNGSSSGSSAADGTSKFDYGSEDGTLKAILRSLAGDGSSDSRRIPSFTRLEERCELLCGFCGAVGHVCQDCPSGVPLLQADHMKSRRDEVSRVASAGQYDPTESAQPTSDSSMSLDDVKYMLSVSGNVDGSGMTHRNAMEAVETDENGDPIIPVPSALPTQNFDPHALMRARAKPSLHRRAKCSYCGSRSHHITQCPLIVSRLDSKSTSGTTLVHFTPPKSSALDVSPHSGTSRFPINDSVMAISTRDASDIESRLARGGRNQGGAASHQRRLVVDQELMKSQANRLFCIKCGSTGHLYYTCPKVPRNLHIALHCPICMQPKKSIVHEPESCPRRVQLPSGSHASGQHGAAGASQSGFLPNGIPKDFLKVEERKERIPRRSQEQTLSSSRSGRDSANGTRHTRDSKWADSTARTSHGGKKNTLFRPVL